MATGPHVSVVELAQVLQSTALACSCEEEMSTRMHGTRRPALNICNAAMALIDYNASGECRKRNLEWLRV